MRALSSEHDYPLSVEKKTDRGGTPNVDGDSPEAPICKSYIVRLFEKSSFKVSMWDSPLVSLCIFLDIGSALN